MGHKLEGNELIDSALSNFHSAWRISAACMIVFLLVVVGVTKSSTVQQVDQDATEVVYHALPLSWCEFMTWWGHTGLYFLAGGTAVVLLLKRQWVLLLVVLIALGGGMLLQSVGKTVVARQRPEFAADAPHTYSFPSGHTLLSQILYGLLVYLILLRTHDKRTRMLVVSASALWIALIGISRVVLGAHYLGDILGSLALGGAWLGVWIDVSQRYRHHNTIHTFGGGESSTIRLL